MTATSLDLSQIKTDALSAASTFRSLIGLGTSATLNAGSANGVATLGADSKLTAAQIPDISLISYLGSVASQAAMLALTGQQGDWCVRSDLSTTWVITGSDPTLLANWTQLSYPSVPVQSVFGRTGAVVGVSTDYSSVGITNTAIGASNPSTGAFTTLTTTGAVTITQGTANTSVLTSTGYNLTGSNAQSLIDLAGTWNTSGTPTAIKLNVTDTASNASSLLLDLQVGGTSKFGFRKNGTIQLDDTYSNGGHQIMSNNNGFAISYANQSKFGISGGFQYFWTYQKIGFTPTNSGLVTAGNATDLLLERDAANTLAQRNGASAQTYRLYNTYTDASNHDRLALSFATYSSVLYARLLAESAGTGAANIGLVLGPKGNGAITASMPDGTSVGGDARGQYAVDLQTSRTLNWRVASGNYSSVLGGTNNVASGLYSVACGGGNFASAQGAVCFGQGNTASGEGSVVSGGYACTASGYISAVAGGAFCGATGQYSFVGGGYSNGASATCTVAIGNRGSADRNGLFAIGSGRFAADGDAQKIEMVLRKKTTDATPATLLWDDNTRLTIPSGKVFAFVAKISGIKSDGSAVAFYTRKGAIKNVGGTTSLVGNIETLGTDTEDNVNTDVAITADDTNDALQINVTGIAAETWRWVAVVEGVEIGYGT